MVLVIVIVSVLFELFLLIIVVMIGVFSLVIMYRLWLIVFDWLCFFVLIFGYVFGVLMNVKIGSLNFLVRCISCLVL